VLARLIRPLVVLLVALAAPVAVGTLTPAAAATCHWNPDGTYECTTPGTPGTPGDPGGDGGGGGEAACELYADYTFCNGTKPCRTIEWHPPFKMPDGEKPTPDSVPMVRECAPGGPDVQGPPTITIYWSGEEPEPPTLAEQAQTAIGELDLALPALLSSPQGRTLVNLPTWFWLDGDEHEITGSSAFGLVAIGTAQEIQVDPGDGSGAITCPWTTTAEEGQQDCAVTYRVPSYDGSASWEGKPAYAATAHATWALRFEVNGTPVTIPGVPTELDGPTSTTPVRVEQTQSLVTGTR
jgi:hypothetical protein